MKEAWKFVWLIAAALVIVLVGVISTNHLERDAAAHETEVYREGFAASRNGTPHHACPYPAYSREREHVAWMRGWVEGFPEPKKPKLP